MTGKHFGKHSFLVRHLHEVMKESIRFKTATVPANARKRLRETIEQMVNNGEKGMITFIV